MILGVHGVLALFAKAPRPGQVKTRLCPPLTPEQAAELYDAMLRDVLEQHRDSGHERVLWFAPADAHAELAERAGADYRLEPQRGAGLAERMSVVFRRHAAEGADAIVLRGTDSPTLPAMRIAQAFELLASGIDLVLCGDHDGGYNLIGLRRPQDALFALEMSTQNVLEQTLRRARSLGLETHVLEPHHDVDTAADLVRLTDAGDLGKAPRTAEWLSDHSDLVLAARAL